MQWKISKKGDKRCFVILFPLLTLSSYYGIVCLILGIISIISIILPFLLFIVIFSSIYKIQLEYWAIPTIVCIDDVKGYVMVKEEYPSGYVTENRIYFDSIYRIEIKGYRNAKIYYSRKGVKYFWHIVRWYLTKEDRETSFQILEEIIKRVDRNKVEIVDLRKR